MSRSSTAGGGIGNCMIGCDPPHCKLQKKNDKENQEATTFISARYGYVLAGIQLNQPTDGSRVTGYDFFACNVG